MKILLVAGGTGGHITPAIALGQAIFSKGNQVKYVCGSRPLEVDIYRSHGIDPVVAPIEGSPLGISSFYGRIKRSFNLLRSLVFVDSEIRSFSPDMCIMFGGYISFPALLSCKIRGVKCFVHEQNSVAGKVTKLAGKLGVQILSGWAECKGVEKFLHVGTPVRSFSLPKKEDALEQLCIKDIISKENKIVVVIGGSLGSSSLNQSIIEAASMIESNGLSYIVLGEIGECPLPDNVLFFKPRWDMSELMALADVVICRGGGATLAEMKYYGIPTVVCPWRGSAEGHQKINAESFVHEDPSSRFIWDPEDGIDVLLGSIDKLSRKARKTKQCNALEYTMKALEGQFLSRI